MFFNVNVCSLPQTGLNWTNVAIFSPYTKELQGITLTGIPETSLVKRTSQGITVHNQEPLLDSQMDLMNN